MRTIIFDVESTGTSRPQICQLAYIIVSDGSIIGRNYFFTVDAMNRYAYKVHHLSMSTLKNLSHGQRFGDRVGEISRDFGSADVYAGHGVSGDIDYLKREFTLLNMKLPERMRFCTMTHFTGRCTDAVLPTGKPKPPRLSELWEHFSLTETDIAKFAHSLFGDCNGAHDARFDATATYLSMQRAARAGELPTGVLPMGVGAGAPASR